jgi:thymidine phosphorylase
VVGEPWAVMERAPAVVPVPSPESGVVEGFGALAIGLAAARLGAGRARKSDPIDHAVGIVLALDPGTRVSAGDPLAWVHARDETSAAAAVDEVVAAARVREGPVDVPPVLIETISS